MPILLMNLRHVPDEEADDVRALLAEHDLDFYETPPNRWGLSAGAIWLRDEAQAETARRLLDDYQRERLQRVRAEYEAERRAGTAPTFAGMLLRHPLRTLAYLAFIALILYFSIRPFLGFDA